MNDNDPHDETLGDAPDRLDELLKQARWPEPDPAPIERLHRRWRVLVGRRRRRAWWSAGIAAAVLLAAALAVWMTTGGVPERAVVQRDGGDGGPAVDGPQRRPGQQEQEGPPQVPGERPGFNGEGDSPERRPEAVRVVARPPTDYELLVLVSASRSRVVTPPEPLGPPAELVEALEILVAKEDADLDKVARPLLEAPEDRERYERVLIRLAAEETDPRHPAATRLLSRLGTRRSLPVLRALASRPATHSAAVEGLARLADPLELVRLIAAEPDPALRRRLLAALVERGTPEAVALYLNFVEDRRTAAAALEVLDGVEDPPVDVLFGALVSPYYEQRMAAARALGRIDGRAVSERLAAMAVNTLYQREALLALLSSRGEDAAQFITLAERSPQLAVAVHAARSQLAVLQ